MIEFLLNEALTFHAKINADAGIRDIGLIESAINSTFQSAFGQDCYPTIFDKAAQLLYKLTNNHGFIDGNKRVALHTAEVFLRVNGLALDCSQDERVAVTKAVASDEMSADDLKFWLVRNVTGSIFITGKITINI